MTCKCNEVNKGNSLAAFLNRTLDSKTNTREERAALIASMGSAAGISSSTVTQILRAEIICPPKRRLEGFAQALKVSLKSIMDAAKNDGCDYDDNEESSSEEIMAFVIDSVPEA